MYELLSEKGETKMKKAVLVFLVLNLIPFVFGIFIGFAMLFLTDPPLTPQFLWNNDPVLFSCITIVGGMSGWLFLGGAKSLDYLDEVEKNESSLS